MADIEQGVERGEGRAGSGNGMSGAWVRQHTVLQLGISRVEQSGQTCAYNVDGYDASRRLHRGGAGSGRGLIELTNPELPPKTHLPTEKMAIIYTHSPIKIL